jgi:hypothetical protein
MIKILIRVMLVAASACMVIGNLRNSKWALTASALFLISNITALVYNELRRKT